MPSTISVALATVLALLGIGLYGLLACRSLIKIIIALQLLVKAAILALVAAGAYANRLQLSQSLAATLIVADTVVAVIGLALAVQVRRRLGTLDVKQLGTLQG